LNNLTSLMLNNINSNSDKIYIKTSDEEISYKKFFQSIKSWQNFLILKEIKKGDRVALISEKSYDQLTAFYAIWSLGGIVVPVNESLGELETTFILKDSSPKLVITSDKFLQSVRKITHSAISFNEFRDHSYKGELISVEVSSDDLAALIYTSGSTGNPKGVMTTHNNFITNAASAVDFIGIFSTDSFYSLLPFWHAFALTVEVVIPMYTGATVCFAKGQRDFAKNIPVFEPSIILAVPRILEVIKSNILKKVSANGKRTEEIFHKAHNFLLSIKEDRRTLKVVSGKIIKNIVFKKIRENFGVNFRFFISGGAPLDRGLQEFFSNMDVPVTQGYGLSETSPIISVDSPNSVNLGSVGPILSWMTPEKNGDFTFLDENGKTGKDLEGELLVKGSCVMAGYWNYSDNTAKTTDDLGWLHTGDVGFLDKDGKLFIKGRKNNMIVLAGGEKVHPEHVEDLLKKSDYIDDIMVIGEKCKNLYACITIPEEFQSTCHTTLKRSIQDEIKIYTKHLAPYQKPKDFLFLPNFTPENGTYTGTMKIRRHVIKELHEKEIKTLLSSARE